MNGSLPSRPAPSRWALWILTHSMAPNIRYAASGDLEQIHADIADAEGSAAANRWIRKEALRSLPHFLSDTVAWTFVMLSNYLRVAYRNLLKNKASSLVNIVGLAIAVATATTAFVFIEYQMTTDHFHEKADRVFLVTSQVDRGTYSELRGDSPAPLGPAMKADLPLVEDAVRIANGGATMTNSSDTFEESLRFVDPGFTRMFSWPMRLGDPEHELQPGEIILSDGMARKYFGDSNPMGQTLSAVFGEDRQVDFTVVAVAAPFPTKMSFSFTGVVHIDHATEVGLDREDWGSNIRATFIEVADPADVEAVAAGMEGFRSQQNQAREDNHVQSFAFQDLAGLSMASYNIAGDISGGSHPASIIVLSLISLFMVLLSCINYVNLATATAVRRLKEIGVRKAIGSSRSQLIIQFLSENVMTCLAALVAGVALAHFVFIPGFNALTQGQDLTIWTANTGMLWLFLCLMLIGTGLLSGAYPAFYISSFRPTVIFRGRTEIGGESWLTRSLLTFQFVLAFLTMIMGVTLAQNANYQASRDWGYESDHLLVLETRNGRDLALLREQVSAVPGVEGVMGSRHHLARNWDYPTVHVGNVDVSASQFDVDAGYLDFLEVPVMAGAAFDESSDTRNDGRVVVNREFAEALGWTPEEAIGQSFRHDSLTYGIAGVTGSILYSAFYDRIEPAFFRAVPESEQRFLSVKIAAGAGASTDEAIRASWKSLFPNREYTGRFQDESFRSLYEENTNIKTLFLFIAVLALVIACMGLYGVAAQKMARRIREIGIRKILGASTLSITRLVNRSFLIILLVAGVVASPLGYLFMTNLLGSIYADPLPIGPSAFALAFGCVLATAALTMSSQIRKLALAQPVDSLRSE